MEIIVPWLYRVEPTMSHMFAMLYLTPSYVHCKHCMAHKDMDMETPSQAPVQITFITEQH